MEKILYIIFFVSVILFSFFLIVKNMGLGINVFRKRGCNYDCLCQEFEEEDCPDCLYDFDHNCSEEIVVGGKMIPKILYIKENLCHYSGCWKDCEALKMKMQEYYLEGDQEGFCRKMEEFNRSMCCYIVSPKIPFLKCRENGYLVVEGGDIRCT